MRPVGKHVGGILLATALPGAAASAAASAGPPFAAIPAEPGMTATFELRDGRQMPMFGLGVYVSRPGPETYNSVKWALETGYRLIDTAMLYRNEKSVGEAIRDSGIPRQELFVTTKLWDDDHGYDATIRACKRSLAELGAGIDYLDLYLIHSPNTGRLVETWDAMVELRRQGLVRSIGVSNFNRQHIEALVDNGREWPMVNQMEMHPLVYQERKSLLQYCFENRILVQAYGSMFFGDKGWLKDPDLLEITAAHPGKSATQVLLRWGLQMGFALIPKSTHKHRIRENSGIFDFELTEREMATLSAMHGELGAYWNPLEAPVHLGRLDRRAPGGEL